MATFFAELKRRNVFKVGVAYAIVAWLIAQIVAVVDAPLHLPDWFDTAVILFLIIGFPLALLLAWAFELTPEGLKTTNSVEPEESITKETGQKLNYTIIGLMALVIIFMVLDNYVLEDQVSFTTAESMNEQTVAPEISLETESAPLVQQISPEPERLPNSVAILPFENLSLDPENAFFAAGIHESTLNQLAKIRGLTVMARTSVMQYEDDPPPIPEIAESLNVETVMEGSVRYANGRVLITAQLIDGLTGAHLWSGEFNRDLIDVFSVQAEVAEQIAMAMQMELIPEDIARIETRPTESVEAYQLYLFALSLSFGIENRPRFIDLLERAIVLDPNFAEAYAQLAFDYGNAGNIGKAIEYAQKTIELDSTVGLAHLALGYISEDYYARQEETESHFERAVELSPNDAFILSYYCYRMADNIENIEEALRICRKAVASDPTSGIAHLRLGNVMMLLGNFSEAINQINIAIEIMPVNHATYLQLATVEYLRGNMDSARENLNLAVQIMSPLEVFRVDYIAYIYGLLGDTNRVENLLTRFEDIYGEDEREAGRTLGWGILGTRDKERSLREWTITINGYIEDDWPISRGRISRFRDNWLNDPMLEEPEFLELRRRLGFSG